MAFLLTGLSKLESWIEHPIDSAENVFNDTTKFVSHPINETKEIFDNEFDDIKQFASNPISGIEREASNIVSEVKRIPTTLERGFDNFEQFGTEVKKDIGIVADGVTTAGRWVWSEAQAIEKGGEQAFNVVRNTFMFVENYYKLILMAGGLYMGSKLYNEVKKTELII